MCSHWCLRTKIASLVYLCHSMRQNNNINLSFANKKKYPFWYARFGWSAYMLLVNDLSFVSPDDDGCESGCGWRVHLLSHTSNGVFTDTRRQCIKWWKELRGKDFVAFHWHCFAIDSVRHRCLALSRLYDYNCGNTILIRPSSMSSCCWQIRFRVVMMSLCSEVHSTMMLCGDILRLSAEWVIEWMWLSANLWL